MDRLLLCTGICLLGTAVWFSDPALAEDEAFDREPVNCIPVNRIRRTEVVDDQSILFFLRGNRIYRAMMPDTCIGLEREQRFAYHIRSGQLCSTDTITVLERAGFGSSGMTCRIGLFHPTTSEAVEELRGVPRRQDEMVPVEIDGEPDPDAAAE